MKINQAGIDLIKHFEGMSLKPYKDPVGIPTIGIGATYYQDGRKVSMNDAPLSEDQALSLLRFHLKEFEDGVVKLVNVPVNDNQFSALVSFAFNCGLGNLKNSTLLKKLNKGDAAGAAEEFLKWTKSQGKELPGLVRRRQAEKALFQMSKISDQLVSDAEIHKMLEDIEKQIFKA